jgi:hypothetical protein
MSILFVILTWPICNYKVFLQVILFNCHQSIPRATIVTQHVTDTRKCAIVKSTISGANCLIIIALVVFLVHGPPRVSSCLLVPTYYFFIVAMLAITPDWVFSDGEVQSRYRHCVHAEIIKIRIET